MSAAQILQELPKLSREERRQIVDKAMDLNCTAAEREEMELAEAAALQLFQFIDQTESDASAHPAR